MFSFISKPFGYLLEWIYAFTNNYAIALLIFALAVKLILFPLGIKQQKNSQRQAKLSPKEAAIRKKYAGRTDAVTKQKMNEEVTKLYQDEKFSPFSGCLPVLIQFPIIIALYDVIRNPLTYLMHLTTDCVAALKNVMLTIEGFANTNVAAITEISVVSEMKKLPEAFSQVLTEYGADLTNIPDLSLFGINLGEIPNLNPFNGWGLVLIPILSLLSSFLSMVLTKKFTYQTQQAKEADGSMKVMQYAMPFFSLYIAFKVPAAVGLYWVYQNLLSPVQQFALSKLYKVPVITEEEIKAAEKQYGKPEKPQKKATASSSSKKRSLVYDDDDDIPALPEEKQQPKPVAPVKSIGQAPLKTDDRQSKSISSGEVSNTPKPKKSTDDTSAQSDDSAPKA